MNLDVVLALLVVSAFLLLPFVLSLYHIVGFHIILGECILYNTVCFFNFVAWRGMTTYDYVVEKHRQARMELNAKAKRASTSATKEVAKMETTISAASAPIQEQA